MKPLASLRAILVMRAPLLRYPPSTFQAAILSEHCWDTSILDSEDGGHHACLLPAGVRRTVLEQGCNPWGGEAQGNRLRNALQRLQFRSRARRTLRRASPDVVFVYEPAAIAAVGLAPSGFGSHRPFLVWHFHEYPELSNRISFGGQRDTAWCRRHASSPDMIIFPDRHRADLFQREIGLAHNPVVVMNCPRKLESVPNPILRERLRDHGYSANGRIVLYNGCVGETHGAFPVLRSMKQWPRDARFVLAGAGRPEFIKRLMAEAHALGVRDRVVHLNDVDPAEKWALRSGMDLAVTFAEPAYINRRYSAGASNKRFEAMAVGIPQVSDDGPGVRDLIQDTGVGECRPHDDPEAIGKAVAALLENEERRREMGKRARQLHLERFHYEHEFQPVLEWIHERLQREAGRAGQPSLPLPAVDSVRS